MYYPDLITMRILRKTYDYIPVYTCIPYDGKDVLDIYQAFKGSYSFLLESGIQTYHGRYSIIALPCEKRFVSDGTRSQLVEQNACMELHGHPMKVLEELFQKKSPIYPQIPVFTGGAIGHFNYDTIRLYEELHQAPDSSLDLPMMQFGFVDKLIVIDHEHADVYFIINAQSDTCIEEYDKICKEIDAMVSTYSQITPFVVTPLPKDRIIQSTHTKKSFMQMVEKAKAHIYAGDIFQVVLSQRLKASYHEDPLQAYARLRTLGASPYMYYLDFDSYVVAGVSPELLLQSRGDLITTIPIAGTRKRGKNDQEDEVLGKELQQDPKETAEHMMLVDLGRNDIGRVSTYGSVKVHHLKHIQRYSHVMHMTSEVTGSLKEGNSAFDALASLLPAGTLSGAPKIRAMQIIDELEPVKREIYGGAIGFLGYNSQFDTCITIRTFLFHNEQVYIQAGAGIVKDSVPEKEYQETLQKAASLLSALGKEVVL